MTRILGSLSWLVLSAGALCAQQGLPMPSSAPAGKAASDDYAAPPVWQTIFWNGAGQGSFDPACWGRADYLLWRIAPAPIAIPLVTGNSADKAGGGFNIGAVNEPGVSILFGNGSGRTANFDWLSGARLTLGAALDQAHIFSLEASGFFLQEGNVNFSASSGGGNSPIVSVPFNTTQTVGFNPPGPTALSAGGGPNTVSVHLDSRLWGAEINQLARLYVSNNIRLSGLLGVRYVDLRESLALNDSFSDPHANVLSVNDNFATRNQFCGVQVGTRLEMNWGRWNLDTTIKAAMGRNLQGSDINGSTTANNGAFGFPSQTTPGGIFAEPSNIGTVERQVFCVVPEAQVQLQYLITPSIRSSIGYNFLYMSNVLRPGNQLNDNLNPPPFFVNPGNISGPPSPLHTLQSSGFWAQGFTLGLEFSF